MQLKTHTTLQGGRYRIIDSLGRGGFGVTYLAEQVMAKRRVCIKEYFPKDYYKRDGDSSNISLSSDGFAEVMNKFKTKFIKEAQTIAALDHQNIIHIHDVFEENGTAYYVMEYIEGDSLDDIVKRNGALSEAEAVGYIRQIASALAYIHNHQIMHLDIKPGNIMLRFKDDRVILIDFGLSKQYDAEGNQTSSTPVGISHGYAPMEQYQQGGVKEFSPETDIYSLGATLYYLVTGKVPPQAVNIADEGLPELPSHLSNGVRNAIERSMEIARKRRPHSIKEFLALLDDKAVVAPIQTPTPESEATMIGVQAVETNEQTVIPTPKAAEPKVEAPKAEQPKKEEKKKKKSKWWLWLLLALFVVGAGGYLALSASTDDTESKATTDTHQGHDYVDLGLSVKWATCNVGANRPEQYGDYYAWGETSTKSSYTPDNCSTWEKCLNDIKGTSRDIAREKWGGNWRMPTKAEFDELIKNCTWTWTTQNGKSGCKVTSKKNGNSIFLPAAGNLYDNELCRKSTHGNYWSSTPNLYNTQEACDLYFYSGIMKTGWGYRCNGYSVRPVLE